MNFGMVLIEKKVWVNRFTILFEQNKLYNMTEQQPTAPAKVKFRRIECPFDLQTIFTVSVDTENLKGLLEFILDHLGEQQNTIKETEVKVSTKMMQVDK